MVFKYFLFVSRVQKYSCCDTFFFIESRKIENLNKAGRIRTCSKIVKRKNPGLNAIMLFYAIVLSIERTAIILNNS